MKEKPLKCYVIMIAKHFPTTHPRKGEETCFADFIYYGQKKAKENGPDYPHLKIHTIRKNYPLSQKRMAEVEAGKAYLSLRQWEGRPYNSKQVEIFKLTKADGVGIQRLVFEEIWGAVAARVYNGTDNVMNGFTFFGPLEANDGLTDKDFLSWFSVKGTKYGYPLNVDFAVIHFTPFRYL